MIAECGFNLLVAQAYRVMPEVTAAEKTGFKVNPQFKKDLADKRKGRP